jgi:hypothetical protein
LLIPLQLAGAKRQQLSFDPEGGGEVNLHSEGMLPIH